MENQNNTSQKLISSPPRRTLLLQRLLKYALAIAPLLLLGFYLAFFVRFAEHHTPPSHAASVNPLPFDMPSQAVLKGSPKKVFAHYFTPFPISLDNKAYPNDGYQNAYLAVNGESGKHAAYGGFIRERPLPRVVDPSANWQFNDMKTEVAHASAAGLDGWTIDLLSLSGYNWDRVNMMLDAAHAQDPSFKVLLMPDGSSLHDVIINNPGALASNVASIANKPSTYHLPDGRLVISPFDPEREGAAWWANWINLMRTKYGINVAFVPCFINYEPNATNFASISYGYSLWGGRNPAVNKNIPYYAQNAHSRGKLWMQPVSVQDERPRSGIYDEAGNSENLRLTWQGAIDGGSDWVQIPTWNDYSEGAEVSPSTHIGWSPLDISSYYIARFKTGTLPAVKRSVLYLSHRIQPAGAAPTGGQTILMHLRGGGSPARDGVEALTILSAPATVTVKTGAATTTYVAPAGLSAQVVPLQIGTVSARFEQAGLTGTVTSPFTIVARPVVQDLQYHYVSTARDGSISNIGKAPSVAPPLAPPPTGGATGSGGSSTPPKSASGGTTASPKAGTPIAAYHGGQPVKGAISLKPPSAATATIKYGNTVVSKDGTIDTTYLPNGKQKLTIESTDQSGIKHVTEEVVDVNNRLNPYQKLRNKYYLLTHGSMLASNVLATSTIVIVLAALVGSCLAAYRLYWRRRNKGSTPPYWSDPDLRPPTPLVG
jgi:hypothetical protein